MHPILGSIHIPLNAATKTFAILAKRGAGKRDTGAVLAEEFFKHHIPFVVFDPIGVWWGLRLARDGKHQGVPVVVFGSEHADIPLERSMGRPIARAIVRDNVSCILSTFGMPKTAQRQLIAEFAEELLAINNVPRHIFLEEAHACVPQRVLGEMGKAFNAVSNVVVMGRNRGIGVTLINQRAATINKDVLTHIDTLLAFRTTAPQDRSALREWVEQHAAAGDCEQCMHSLPSLPTGEGWIWSPEFLGRFERITIRARETFHPDREQLGDTFVMPEMERRDIQQFITSFAASWQQDTQKPARPTPTTAGILPRNIEQELTAVRNDYESQLLAKDAALRQRDAVLNQIRRLLAEVPTSLPHHEQPVQSPGIKPNVAMWIEKLGNGGASRILKFLAEKSGMKFRRTQIALAVGLSARSGSFAGYLAHLKRNHLIVEQQGEVRINPDL
jgi:hypothetical protein